MVNRGIEPLPPGRWLRNRLRHALEITSTDIVVRRADFELLHLVFLSDVHSGLFMNGDEFLEIAKLVAALQPDLVCIGGDLVNTRWQEVEPLAPALEVLRAPLGVFAVPGNHEYYRRGHVERWTEFLQARGIEVLTNRGVRLETGGSTLWLAGVDDLTEGQPDFDAALAGRRDGEATVLLSHHPDTFLEACDLGVGLQLSGHTHGGQILIRGHAPLAHSRHGFVSGLYERNGSRLYVGRGAGVTALPIRIGAPPEIALLRLR